MLKSLLIGARATVLIALLVIFKEPLVYVSLISALLHEAGHILCAAALGVKLSSVRFTLGGVKINADFALIKGADEVMILLAGSGVNFLLCLVSGAVPLYSEAVLGANLLMGIFNLLPSEGLDGGSIARILLEKRFLPEKAYKIQKILSHFTMLAIWFFSIPVMVFSKGNPSLYCVFMALLFVNLRAFG